MFLRYLIPDIPSSTNFERRVSISAPRACLLSPLGSGSSYCHGNESRWITRRPITYKSRNVLSLPHPIGEVLWEISLGKLHQLEGQL